jgi:hypothetical protein
MSHFRGPEGEFIAIGQVWGSECTRCYPVARIILPGRFPPGTSPANSYETRRAPI